MLCSLLSFLLISFSFAESPTLTVGAKRFLESEVLGEIIAQQLEHQGYNVRRRFGLGGTFIAYQALKEEEIDVYVEYTGTIAEAIYKKPTASEDELRKMAQKDGLRLLPNLGFNNTYVVITRPEVSQKFKIKSLSDLADHPKLKAGFSAEFLKRKDGWPQLAKTYGLKNQVRAIENPMGYQALSSKMIDVAEAYSTDAIIEQMGFVALKDDRGYFPEYMAFPFTHKNLPEKAKAAVLALTGRFDEAKMMALTARAMNRESVRSVAQSFLVSERLIEGEDAVEYRSLINWTSLARRTKEHLALTFLAVLFATFFAIPLAILIHNFKGMAGPTLGITGVLQTIPSIALLSFMIPFFGIGFTPALVGLFLYSLLPIVRNTYTALESIDPKLILAAKGIGLYPSEIFWSVKLPLSLPVILAGVRTATIINIGTATLAAFIGAGGLGEPIVTGLAMNDSKIMLEGALPAAGLAIVVDLLFGMAEKTFVRKL